MVLLDSQLDWIERHLGDWKSTLPRVCYGSVAREGGHVGQLALKWTLSYSTWAAPGTEAREASSPPEVHSPWPLLSVHNEVCVLLCHTLDPPSCSSSPSMSGPRNHRAK